MEKLKLVCKNNARKNITTVSDETFGLNKIIVMAGPCAVENHDQIFETALAVKKSGASFLRGGTFKPRTSPYSFQGLGLEGLKLLRKAADSCNLKTISEVLSVRQLEVAAPYCDMIQVGARNMQNFELLKAVGRMGIPVLLKRGFACTFEELFCSAEYIMSNGNSQVVLCERGVRSYDPLSQNVLDLSAVPIIKEKTCLPVVIDPSHAAKNKKYVSALTLAAVAAGADGLLIEVHPDPKSALSDANQQLSLTEYDSLLAQAKKVASAVNRYI